MCLLVIVAAALTATRTAMGSTIRVVSYNLWGVPIITPDRSERIDEMARRVAELAPDLVALQEVWEGEDAARIAPVLAAAGLTEQRHYGPRLAGGRGAGLLVASRYPITEERFVRFETGRRAYVHWHLDYMSNKGTAVIEVTTPAGPLRFASTHLQSHYAFGDYDFVQLAQVMSLAETVEAKHPETPLIVAGDINAEPGSLVSDVLRARLELAPAADFELDVIMARGSPRTSVLATRVEQLWRGPVTFANGMRRTLSDHPCVVADYALEPCAGCHRPDLRWADVTGRLRAFLEGNAADTRLFMTICQTLAFALPALAALGVRRTRQRKPTGMALVLSLSLPIWLVIAAVWAAYFGWSYGPYKLDTIATLLLAAS